MTALAQIRAAFAEDLAEKRRCSDHMERAVRLIDTANLRLDRHLAQLDESDDEELTPPPIPIPLAWLIR